MAAFGRLRRFSVMPLLIHYILSVSLFGTHDAVAVGASSFGPGPMVSDQGLASLESRQSAATGQNGYHCSLDSPCQNGACCGISGWCGYGPTYCGDGCLSNCDAKAECGQYSETGNGTCPLNVCCSQFGFCGTTEDFCGTGCQSNCGAPNRPSGKGGDVRDNVFGYYESWKSSGSECGVLDPSQLPVEALKAINYAFAYITPGTYDIVPMPGESFDLITQVANAKMRNPDTKMWVSIGGWTFNDNHTSTQPVFSDISSSLQKQAAFARKLTEFMSQYGFDGVDLDWEYPGAGDRGGHGTADIKNFPVLLQIIKAKFTIEKKAWGLSITVPTSYWYLRWFDLPSIAQYIDFFNIMSYDLHGTWDSNNPIGSIAYAHTNLTEIDSALDLFWRENIDPSMVNLGLAFYGRSFELEDPSCREPGCPFKGPGAQGPCTKTAGILSYREIQNILNDEKLTSFSVYDADAAVNYLVYNQTSWVSFDDRTTFQQKIDFANDRGLRGLFIWAVDQDTDDFAALKAVTGKDIAPSIDESSTLGGWDVSKCWITPCGIGCQQGFIKMVGLNQNREYDGCPNSGDNSQQRSLCCPPWGAPDPSTCQWHGTASECYGQCDPGEVLMATDNFGGGSWCRNGVKAFCCPATSGAAAVAACQWLSGGSCTNELPQQMSVIGGGFTHMAFCCPAEPVFKNCGWHGDDTTCTSNRCDVGQVELARSGAEGWGCVLGRQKAFCCDPPFGGTAFVPVPLENLFPEALPSEDAPVYYEAFDHGSDMNPTFDSVYTDDPNEEPFAWIIMVGAEEDVQSLRRRDGSHLEVFDCPTPEPGDFSVQTLKAVCMAESGEDRNCEDMTLGSVRGTIARLPENCGPDEWVRVVSFRSVPDHPLPHHLYKRAPESAKVYEIKYDYNFRRLRRDGGEVYVRVDASDHPGYWDKIVSSVTASSKRSYAPHEWRDFHMSWFEKHGYTDNAGTNSSGTTGRQKKRGFGTASWWSDAFKSLLKSGTGYGFHKKYKFSQVLYSASKSCPGTLDASVEARIEGTFETRLDYGISLIGTLKDFNFDEAYAYFSLSKMTADGHAIVDAHAAFQIESQKVPILQSLDPFGGSFNIKGIFEVGPYFDITAQLQASLTASGTASAGIRLSATELTWMYPKALTTWPDKAEIHPWPTFNTPTAGTAVDTSIQGSLTMSMFPTMGFQIIMAYGGASLVNSEIKATMQSDIIWRVGASPSPERCDGAYYAIDGGVGVTISLTNPLPGWDKDPQTYSAYPYETVSLLHSNCYPWNTSSSTSTRRNVDGTVEAGMADGADSGNRLSTRGVIDSLFPDGLGSMISCPTDFYSDAGDCNVEVGDYTGDYADVSARDTSALETEDDDDGTFNLPLWTDMGAPTESDEDTTLNQPGLAARQLGKRMSSKDPFDFCDAPGHRNEPKSIIQKIRVSKLSYFSSGDMLKKTSGYTLDSFLSYGPLNPSDCDDYSFGRIATPAPSESLEFASEHVLEWQMLKMFLLKSPSMSPLSTTQRSNPAAPGLRRGQLLAKDPSDPTSPGKGVSTWTYCSYMWFWWSRIVGVPQLTYDGLTGTPIDILNKAIPNKDKHASELQLLSKEANNLKERIWGGGQIRDHSLMDKYVTEDVNRAINNCKQLMFAVKYMQIPEVAALLLTQATRVGTYFDGIEDELAKIPTSSTYTSATYQKLNLGDAWRKYIYASFSGANSQQKNFLNEWVPKLVATHLSNTGGNPAGGGQQPGGMQTNPAVVKRVQALQAAYTTFLQTPWTNPFPAAWA